MTFPSVREVAARRVRSLPALREAKTALVVALALAMGVATGVAVASSTALAAQAPAPGGARPAGGQAAPATSRTATDGTTTGTAIARAAAAQIGVTLTYDASYQSIAYPGGDVPADRGVCTDVVIRAFRSIGVDLQREIHDDMRRHFAAYPRLWGLDGPDRNIDHRRVPNLMRFLERQGRELPPRSPFAAGDVVAWRLPNGLLHVGVVAEARPGDGGRQLAVHNIGRGARLEDVLGAFEQLGHYRW
jgi:uncharacterized protein YijF (DUF1287 family)